MVKYTFDESYLIQDATEQCIAYALGGPATEVVKEPDSMYTPLKYQSSAALSEPDAAPEELGRRNTPKCQSAPFYEEVSN